VKVDLRSEVFETELGMWQSWYDLLHSVDNPWNAWPSLHIVQSLLAVLVITRWHGNASKIWLVRILWLSWFMLMISVMTTKQHFIWDVISGVCIALIAWKYWILPALKNSHSKDIVSEFDYQ
ncbi:MAG: phosphatase PAP2 family protein, partial [Candidatus Thermoplasmatota archaeon]|nr:phosphatase PAP2 family protein [Candidatus Thermoplasmatota archaeon]